MGGVLIPMREWLQGKPRDKPVPFSQPQLAEEWGKPGLKLKYCILESSSIDLEELINNPFIVSQAYHHPNRVPSKYQNIRRRPKHVSDSEDLLILDKELEGNNLEVELNVYSADKNRRRIIAGSKIITPSPILITGHKNIFVIDSYLATSGINLGNSTSPVILQSVLDIKMGGDGPESILYKSQNALVIDSVINSDNLFLYAKNPTVLESEINPQTLHETEFPIFYNCGKELYFTNCRAPLVIDDPLNGTEITINGLTFTTQGDTADSEYTIQVQSLPQLDFSGLVEFRTSIYQGIVNLFQELFPDGPNEWSYRSAPLQRKLSEVVVKKLEILRLDAQQGFEKGLKVYEEIPLVGGNHTTTSYMVSPLAKY